MIKDPLTWTEIEMKNCYSLYLATNLWELDDSITFREFKTRIVEDNIFLKTNHQLDGMDKETYNPWEGGT